MNEAVMLLKQSLGDVVRAPGEVDFTRHRRDFIVTAPDALTLAGVAYPRNTAEVAEILRVCHAHELAVTPQGGLTGMSGGAVPVRPSLILSLERMRAIEEVDPAAATMTVQAGVVLQAVNEAAEAQGMLFPLDLGARGSAQVGGNAATNAGGNRVLRYGMMRELILGLEVVLADGSVVTSLNKMLKNNAGYDLKHLFIGSEGTLGVITRLVLRLFPRPAGVCTALVAVRDFEQVLALLRLCREQFSATLGAFEAMWPEFYRLGTTALGRQPPLPQGHGQYILVETLGSEPHADQPRFEAVLAEALERGIATDAAIAQSGKERAALWAIRDSPGEFPRMHWPQIGFDVSLPIGDLDRFASACRRALVQRWPGVHTVAFGHIADSNLHLSVRYDASVNERDLEEEVYRTVAQWNGSISAEHGIGSLKREFLHFSRSPEELRLMRTLKQALDPKGILNPGKVI